MYKQQVDSLLRENESLRNSSVWLFSCCTVIVHISQESLAEAEKKILHLEAELRHTIAFHDKEREELVQQMETLAADMAATHQQRVQVIY